MQIEAIGEMVDFKDLAEGQLFFAQLDKDPTFAMRVVTGMSNRISLGVVSFSHEAHPTMPAPIFLDSAHFANRSVLVLKNATFKTSLELSKWRFGTPSLNRSGSVMLGSDGAMFIRTYQRDCLLDVDVVSGVAEAARNRPEQLWTDEWRIVIDRGDRGEQVLLDSTKQKLAA